MWGPTIFARVARITKAFKNGNSCTEGFICQLSKQGEEGRVTLTATQARLFIPSNRLIRMKQVNNTKYCKLGVGEGEDLKIMVLDPPSIILRHGWPYHGTKMVMTGPRGPGYNINL